MKPTKIILFTWLAWILIVIGFQSLATARINPQYPDRAQAWLEASTYEGYQDGHIYLTEPFLNNQAAWDSEYYLAIALGGYDNPNAPTLTPAGVQTVVRDHAVSQSGTSFSQRISLSYAFFPFYPMMIRIFSYPLQVFGMNPIATASLAGVIVSALGALLGMLALFDLTRDSLGDDGALRASLYLIIFPTGFFLTQIYTEGLFVGLTFSSLAMLRRKNWLLAAILGACATMTRAVGGLLIIPMLIQWFRTGEWLDLDMEWRQIFHQGIARRQFYHFVLVISPLIVFTIWKFSYLGLAFDYIEANYFRRGFLSLGPSYSSWVSAFKSIVASGNPQQSAHYITEVLGLILGVVTCIATVKKYPEIAWFSIMVVFISAGSGYAQGMLRYILGAPAVFITLARWGRNPVFDRAWTVLSILLMGLLSALFAFDMWVA